MGSARKRPRRRSGLRAAAAPAGAGPAPLSLKLGGSDEPREWPKQPEKTVGSRFTATAGAEEIEEIAARCGLTATESAVLAMARLQQYTQREIAAKLGLTPRQVSETLVDALRKARAGFERAASPRALFWEEVRQKARCIYRRRRVGWIR
jgi:DNA-directed RNA polymerase specialized sigma24 family protein